MSKLLDRITHQHPFCSAVIVAAGTASRMKGVDKITTEIGGKPVIYYTVSAFEHNELIDEIIIVTREDLLDPIGTICKESSFTKVRKLIIGGEDRAHSVMNGIKECSEKASMIAIHDGARPFVSQRIITETIRAADKGGAAAPAIPVTDTIKRAEKNVVLETPDRSTLFAVQTPQIFDGDLIRGALHYCIEHRIALTDDCSAVEAIGKKVALTQGETTNIKITTQLDLAIGGAILCQSVT